MNITRPYGWFMIRFKSGQKVLVVGHVAERQTLDAIPDGEVVTVFEDYGQPKINVMRSNGQLRCVARSAVSGNA